jgi:arylsulfatase A
MMAKVFECIPLLLLATAAMLSQSANVVAGDKKLNVVFILADDLGWGELGCYGQLKIPTPHLDRLAAEGMRFSQHYSGAPVCAPSRCVLMTGRHLGHAEVRGNMQAKVHFPQFSEGQIPLTEGAMTVAQLFQSAGYATGAIGKWGLGPVGSSGEPSRKGFDLFFGYNCQAVAHSYFPKYLWRNAEQVLINQRPVPGAKKQVDGEVRWADWQGEQYAPKLMIAEAERFIDANRARPFFLYLPFIEPHVAMHPPRESLEKFPAEWDTEPYRGQCSYLPHPRPRAGYAAMISDLDSYVGRVMAALEAAGVADQTLVVFSSDNGTTHPGQPDTHFHVGGVDAKFFNSTAGLRGYKGSVYEGGIRVPMIARLPGRIQAGTVNASPSYFADWFPTLCDAAGIAKPKELDGDSLWPILTNGGADDPACQAFAAHRKPMLWVFPEYGGQVAVRIGKLKAVRQGLRTKAPSAWEIYDIAVDRNEQRNIAADHVAFIEQVTEVLRREVADNKNFPLSIPGVNAPGS